MGTTERNLSPKENGYAVVALARKFTADPVPFTVNGLTQAVAILQEQHTRAMPKYSYDELYATAGNRDLAVVFEQLASSALEHNDYGNALMMGNLLYALGDIDINRGLGGGAFDMSYRFHQDFLSRIVHTYGGDQFIRYASNVLSDIRKAAELEFRQDAFSMMRAFIHMVSANGTLGREAKAFTDPQAIVNLGME